MPKKKENVFEALARKVIEKNKEIFDELAKY